MKKLGTILIVDDDELIITMVKRLIEQLAVADTIALCSNGFEAISFLKREFQRTGDWGVDLIFLDLYMPQMDGFEFLEEFNELMDLADNTKPIPVYVLTGSEDERDKHKAAKFGIAGFLEKPLSKERIEKAIREVNS